MGWGLKARKRNMLGLTQAGWKHKNGHLAGKLLPVPAKPAWGKSFINGGFKQHLMSLWDAFLGPNTTAVVVCAGTRTLLFLSPMRYLL
jgi:hypothetical protein